MHIKPAGAVDLGKDKRYADFVTEDGVIHEVKNIKGPLGEEQQKQFNAYLEALSREMAVTTRSGAEIEVKRLEYTFLDVEGAKRNLDWIHESIIAAKGSGNDCLTVRPAQHRMNAGCQLRNRSHYRDRSPKVANVDATFRVYNGVNQFLDVTPKNIGKLEQFLEAGTP